MLTGTCRVRLQQSKGEGYAGEAVQATRIVKLTEV